MRIQRAVRGMGALLAVSMAVTEGLLICEGRWQEAIPLHLCSLSALAAFACAIGMKRAGMIDFLWYLGLPGALLALIFPAPASSKCQALFTASYVVTHALIVCIPLGLMRMGVRPRPKRALRVMLFLQEIALVAFAVNRLLGTNFLFLALPPAGTPLETAYAWGKGAYLFALEGMALCLCLFQGALLCAADGSD